MTDRNTREDAPEWPGEWPLPFRKKLGFAFVLFILMVDPTEAIIAAIEWVF